MNGGKLNVKFIILHVWMKLELDLLLIYLTNDFRVESTEQCFQFINAPQKNISYKKTDKGKSTETTRSFSTEWPTFSSITKDTEFQLSQVLTPTVAQAKAVATEAMKIH